MNRRTTLAALAALGLTALCLTPAHAQTGYTVVDVGRLSGMDGSYPNAINADDATNPEIVGTNFKTGSKKHAFYWSTRTGLMDVGVLGAGSYSEAFSVNRYGEVVGQSATTSTGANNHAIYWNPNRGSVPLDLAPAWAGSWAYSINDSGVIVGYVYNQQAGRLWAYWAPSTPGVYGEPILLTGLPNAAVTASGPGQGRFITAASDILGELADDAGVHHAAIWKNAGTPSSPAYGPPVVIPAPAGAPAGAPMYAQILTVAVGGGKVLAAGTWSSVSGDRGWVWSEGDAAATDIGTLGSTYSTQVWGLNGLGQISGHSSIDTAQGTRLRAVAWDAGTGLLDLGTLGGTESRAYGTHFNGLGYTINNAGQVVGYSKTARDKSVHAFVWTASAGMRDLNDTALTPSKGVFSYLQDASGISGGGLITGTGIVTKGGYTDTYLLLPR